MEVLIEVSSGIYHPISFSGNFDLVTFFHLFL